MNNPSPTCLTQILCASILFTLPVLSYATPPLLTIGNNTPEYTAMFKFNNGDCSSDIMGVTGLIKAHAWNMFTNDMMKSLCGNNTSNCKIDFYMSKTNKCDGPVIATIVFDIQKGLISVDSKKMNGFYVYKTGDNAISIEGGPIQEPASTTPTSNTNTSTTNSTTTPAASSTSTSSAGTNTTSNK